MKRALITGASTGFGRLLATALLDDGWTVFATLRGAEKRGELFAADKAKYGERLKVLSLDVAEAGERESAARAVEKAGGLDLLVNNAGYGQFGPCEEVTEDEWRRQFEVNFFGALFLTRRLLPALRASKGRVINVSSILGLAAFPLGSPYCASKFALEGWSEALYYELRPHGVQVCVVEPGGFRTDFNRNMIHPTAAASSPYRGQVERYRKLNEKKMARAGVPPEKVVRLMVALASERRLPLRAVVGVDAKALDGVMRWLPRNWSTSLLGAVYSRLLSADA